MPLRLWGDDGEQIYGRVGRTVWGMQKLRLRLAELQRLARLPFEESRARWPSVSYFDIARMRAKRVAFGRRTRWIGNAIAHGLRALKGRIAE